MKETIILQTQSISIGYHNKKVSSLVAKAVSIALKKGKLTALIGANGIGKSTLLKTITGIQTPIMGDVLLHGKNILVMHRSQKLGGCISKRTSS